MRNIVYLNGQFVALKDAHISVLDRGFLFGDGVYEVMPCFGGNMFRFKQHLQRLKTSLELVNIALPDIDFARCITELREKNNSENDAIYCQITRGTDTKRQLKFPSHPSPTVLIACMAIHPYTLEELRRGIKTITLEDRRWDSCNIKAITLLPNVLMQNTVLANQADEAVLLRNGFVSESCSSNVFIVKNNQIITPPKDCRILGGITRDFIVEICRDAGFTCVEKNISRAELFDADEIWLTSSNKHILAVVQIDGLPVNQGKVGPLWETVIELYNQHTHATTHELCQA